VWGGREIGRGGGGCGEKAEMGPNAKREREIQVSDMLDRLFDRFDDAADAEGVTKASTRSYGRRTLT
jgi:hypothetical protein